MKKISILIPCYNEEEGIAHVINDIPHQQLEKHGYKSEVIVIDNNSTDRTAQIAQKHGAKVLYEKNKGKGHAIKTGFEYVSDDTDYVVMLDGDNTYKLNEILRLIEPLESNFGDVIVGSRLSGKTKDEAFRASNRLANWVFTFLIRAFYTTNITDVLSGYFAWKKHVVKGLLPHLNSTGFSIEMEMMTKMVKLGYDVYSVPITYDRRKGESKIETFKDGWDIFKMFLRNLFWKPIFKMEPTAQAFIRQETFYYDSTK